MLYWIRMVVYFVFLFPPFRSIAFAVPPFNCSIKLWFQFNFHCLPPWPMFEIWGPVIQFSSVYLRLITLFVKLYGEWLQLPPYSMYSHRNRYRLRSMIETEQLNKITNEIIFVPKSAKTNTQTHARSSKKEFQSFIWNIDQKLASISTIAKKKRREEKRKKQIDRFEKRIVIYSGSWL